MCHTLLKEAYDTTEGAEDCEGILNTAQTKEPIDTDFLNHHNGWMQGLVLGLMTLGLTGCPMGEHFPETHTIAQGSMVGARFILNTDSPRQDIRIEGSVTDVNGLNRLLSESFSHRGHPEPRFSWHLSDEDVDVVVRVDNCEGEVVREETWFDNNGNPYIPLVLTEDFGFSWPGGCTENESCQFQRCVRVTNPSGLDVDVLWAVDATLAGKWLEKAEPSSDPVDIEFQEQFLDE